MSLPIHTSLNISKVNRILLKMKQFHAQESCHFHTNEEICLKHINSAAYAAYLRAFKLNEMNRFSHRQRRRQQQIYKIEHGNKATE